MSKRRSTAAIAAGIAVGACLSAAFFALIRSGSEEEALPDETLDAPIALEAAPAISARDAAAPEVSGDCVLSGRVLDADGRPIEGAVVRARLLDAPWSVADLPAEARSDRTGAYSLEGLSEERRYQVWAWAPGLATASHLDVPCGSETDLALEPGASLVVTAVDERGETVEGWWLLIGSGSLWPPRESRDLPAGEVEIHGLGPGQHVLWAGAPGLAGATETPIDLEVGETERVSLALVRAPTARATLVGPGGEPASSATVMADLSQAPALRRVVSPGPGGVAKIEGLPPGRHPISVFAPGASGCAPALVSAGDEISLRVLPGGSISGEVRDEEGRPVEGATILVDQEIGRASIPAAGASGRRFLARVVAAARDGWPGIAALNDGRLVAGPSDVPLPDSSGIFTGEPRTQWAPTGPDGRFSISGLPAGRLAVGAEHPELITRERSVVDLEPGGSVSGAIVSMRRGARISIRVVDERGYPVRDATVSVRDEDGEPIREGATATDGFVGFEGLPGGFRVEAVADGFVPAVARARDRAGDEIEVEIALSNADKQIRGRVVDQRGWGIAGAAVAARSTTRGIAHALTATAADDGTFTLEGAGGGSYHVTAEAPDGGRAQVPDARWDEEITLVVGAPEGAGDQGFVTPEMLAEALGHPGAPGPAPTGGSEDLGVIAVTRSDGDAASYMTEYGPADRIVVTGPPSGKGGLPVVLGMRGGRVVVRSVAPGSRVAAAGLSPGDVVVAVDERPVSGLAQARRAIEGPIGSVVMVEVLHEGERLNVVVQRVLVGR